MSWNFPPPVTTGELYTAATHNTYVLDNIVLLKTSIDDNGHPKIAIGTQFSNYTLTPNDDMVLVIAAGISITMPTVPQVGKPYIIKCGPTGTATIFAGGVAVIDGSPSILLSQYDAAEIIWNGTEYSVIRQFIKQPSARLNLGNIFTAANQFNSFFTAASQVRMPGIKTINLVAGANNNVDIGDAFYVVIVGHASGSSVTGFAGGVTGRVIFVTTFNSGPAVTYAWLSGSSAGGNQLAFSSTGAAHGGGMILYHDGAFWRPLGNAAVITSTNS